MVYLVLFAACYFVPVLAQAIYQSALRHHYHYRHYVAGALPSWRSRRATAGERSAFSVTLWFVIVIAAKFAATPRFVPK